jgi:hypothetical protein
MRVLFDHGTPTPLRHALAGHTISTVYEMGWAGLDNGSLLDAAEGGFDVLITTDKNLQHQQNLRGRRLAILVLPTTSWPKVQGHVSEVASALNAIQPGDLVEVAFS